MRIVPSERISSGSIREISSSPSGCVLRLSILALRLAEKVAPLLANLARLGGISAVSNSILSFNKLFCF